MPRFVWLAVLAVSCGRGSGVADQDLGGLVVAAKPPDAPIDVARAASDPGELGRALMRPFRADVAVLGPHGVTLSTSSVVSSDGGAPTTLSDLTTIEMGSGGAWHGTYTNSADYGREAIVPAGAPAVKQLFLRPRYQRWHRRAPETPDEPLALEDSFATAVGATWDLLAPGAELTDLGTVQVAGRAGRKIGVQLTPTPRAPDRESLPQRKWRESRRVEALAGEVVLDADKGTPLSVQLAGTIGFQRDGKAFDMKVTVTSTVDAIGAPVAIASPLDSETVATPERLREVDDRDFLLQGMAPPARAKPSEVSVGSGSGSSTSTTSPRPATPDRAAPPKGGAEVK